RQRSSLSTHVCRLPGSISGSCSASLEPNPDSKIYRTLSSARLRWDRRGNLGTTSASLRYWNSARQRYCRQLVRYRKTLASLPTRSPSQQPRPARKAGFSTFENDCGREPDCLLEGDGFELPVPGALGKAERARRRKITDPLSSFLSLPYGYPATACVGVKPKKPKPPA